MRLSEVLGRDVFDRDGKDLGKVHDARLVQDGDRIGPFGAALRLHELVVGKGSLGARLGLDRARRPWLLRVLFTRRRHLVPWERIDRVTADGIHVDCTAEECEAFDAAVRGRTGSGETG